HSQRGADFSVAVLDFLFITLLSGRSGLSPLLGAPAGRGKGKIRGLSGLLQPQADPSGTANVSCPHRPAGNQNLFHPLGDG
ncbi:hypothetical protein KAX17_10805, partial [Candidatus Bipolaricaulota bacterium]|nr:hypothetical protein [Candidatus Bipolaricaulota bacterium]